MAMTVSASIQLNDMMSGPIQHITSAMNIMLDCMSRTDTATNAAFDSNKIYEMHQHIDMVNVELAETEQRLNNVSNKGNGAAKATRDIAEATKQVNTAQKSYNSSLGQTAAMSNSIVGSIEKYITMAATAYGGKQLIGASDTWTNNSARLGLITDNLQQQAVLQERIYRSAKASRGAYGETVDVVAKLGLLAGDAFGSNEETVKFTELMNKSFKLSGASQQEKTAAMYQLTQAMASGRLQGDEFRSIIENAPMLANAIAEYTGVGREGLKELSSDGAISAEIIKNSLFSVADDIESKFSTLPMTFGDVWTNISSDATMAFAPVYKKLNEMLNGDMGQEMLNEFTEDIKFAAEQIQDVLNWGGRMFVKYAPELQNIKTDINDIITEFTKFRGVGYNVMQNIASAFTSRGASTSVRIFANNLFYIAQAGSDVMRVLSPALPVITAVYVGFRNYKMLSGIFTPIAAGIQQTVTRVQSLKIAMEGAEQATEAATTAQKTYNIVTAANVLVGIASAVLSIATAWKSVTAETNSATRAAMLQHQASAGYTASQDTIRAREYANANNVDMETARLVIGIQEDYHTQREALAQDRLDKFIEAVKTDSSLQLTTFDIVNYNKNRQTLNNEEAREIQEVLESQARMAELERQMAELEKVKSVDLEGETASNTKEIAKNTEKIESLMELIKDNLEKEAIAKYTANTKTVTYDLSGATNVYHNTNEAFDAVKELANYLRGKEATSAEGI